MRSQASRRRPFDLMDAIAIVLWVVGAGVIAFGVWAAFALLASMSQYIPSLP